MCEDFMTDLPLYVAGGLAGERRAAMESHLAGCAACRAARSEWGVVCDAVISMAAVRAAVVPAYRPPDAVAEPQPQENPSASPTRGGAAPRPRTRDVPAAVAVGGRTRRRALAVVLVAVAGLLIATMAMRDRAWVRFAERAGPGSLGGDLDRVAQLPATPVRRQSSPSSKAADSPVPHATAGPVGSPAIGWSWPTPPVWPTPDLAGAGAITATQSPLTAASTGAQETPDTDPGAVAARMPPPTPTVPPPSQPPPLPPDDGADLPNPGEPADGTILGTVYGPDALPRAEIRIVADRVDGRGEDQLTTDTGPSGAYTLTVPAGDWLLRTEAATYRPGWHPGRPSPLLAQPLAVGPGGSVRSDFVLVPSPAGVVEGQVIDVSGTPIGGAVVIAAPPQNPAAPLTAAAGVFTDVDGRFSLPVAWGSHVVGASRSWRGTQVEWWSQRGFGEASEVEVLEGGEAPWLVIVLAMP